MPANSTTPKPVVNPSSTDPVFDLIHQEEIRQSDGLELIPSENYVSANVLKAMGSVLTNKYSEGYPGKRYYGGNENVDQIETLAIERAKQLFHADHANVQPHSGANANEAVYFAWCQPGDTILAMSLPAGGHLTHAHPRLPRHPQRQDLPLRRLRRYPRRRH